MSSSSSPRMDNTNDNNSECDNHPLDPLSASPSSAASSTTSSLHNSITHKDSHAHLATPASAPISTSAATPPNNATPAATTQGKSPSAIESFDLRVRRLLFRKDAGIFFTGIVFIVAPCSVFSRYVIPQIADKYSIATTIVFIWLWVMTLVCMFRTSYTDPGFLPRNLDPETMLSDSDSAMIGLEAATHVQPPVAAYQKQNPTNPANFLAPSSSPQSTLTSITIHPSPPTIHQSPPPRASRPSSAATTFTHSAPLPQGYPFITTGMAVESRLPFNPDPHVVYINGVAMSLKFCITCRIWRPPRASHCSTCDRCVDNHDHHCPWMANCVGKRNYRYFYGFICLTAMLAGWVFAWSLVALLDISKEVDPVMGGDAKGFGNAIRQSPANLVLMIYTFVIGWSVLGMACYHTWITCNAFTTHEQIRERSRFENSRLALGANAQKEGQSPFSRGNGCSNWFWTICRSEEPRFDDKGGDLYRVIVGTEPGLGLPPSDLEAAHPSSFPTVSPGQIRPNQRS
ncbi:DHHC palmitoyltransferase-domain-containing protein [Powellomyces hirtus]|nr:DHHC palmitoyltransferase-domain-containing protein [Powellomyces hirtus]